MSKHILPLLLLLVGINTYARTTQTTYSGTCGEKINWSLDTQDSVLYLTGSGAMTQYAKITDLPWDTLRQYIKHAYISDSITYLYRQCFNDCKNLEELYIPNSVTNQPTLSECSSLRWVHISEQVTAIEFGTFSGCSALDSIYLPDNVESIAGNAFMNMGTLPYFSFGKKLQNQYLVQFHATTIQKVDYRGTVADLCSMNTSGIASPFSSATHLYIGGEEITDLYIPDSVPEVKNYVFQNFTNLRSASFYERTTVAPHAFDGCFIKINMRRDSLPDIIGIDQKKITDKITYYYSRPEGYISFNGSGDMPDYMLGEAPWAGYVFDSIYFSDQITSVGNNNFNSHPELKHIHWNYAINTIGYSAFENCYGLRELTLPISLDKVYSNAFAGCDGLREIRYYRFLDFNETDFPRFAKFVELDTFQGDWYETTYQLVLQDSVMTIDGEGMANISATTPWVHVKDKVKELHITGNIHFVPAIMYQAHNLEKVRLSDSVKILQSTFDGCNKLHDILLPSYLEEIRAKTFSGCTSLSNLVIPDGVTTIGSQAFNLCTSLSHIDLPKNLRVVESYAFSGCKGLQGEFYFPDSVTSIGANVFNTGKYGITSVRLPRSIQTIGANAFVLDSLTSFRYAGTVEDWIKVQLADGASNPSRIAQQIRFEENRLPSELHFSDTVESIGAYTFLNDTLIREISYYSHTTIGTDAFAGTKANIIVKDAEAQTTDATIHGALHTHTNQQIIRVDFSITQQKTKRTIAISTTHPGTFLLDWSTGTYRPIINSPAHHMPMDEYGTVVVIVIRPQPTGSPQSTANAIDVTITDLPSMGKYPYTLTATTEYTQETIREYTNKQGETSLITHAQGEQANYLVCEGVLNTDDDGSILYWGGDNFFVPSERTDVYDLMGRYIGKWNTSLPRGVYVIKENGKSCKWGW